MCATASCKASCKACVCATFCNALCLHIAVSLKGRTTRIWSFGCGFDCATAMGCAGFRLFLVQLLFYNY